MTTIQRMFTVDGKPFFPLGGQVHNSSAYTMEGLEPASALYSGIFLERVGRDQRFFRDCRLQRDRLRAVWDRELP